jgi:hypothetical protein
MPTSLPDQRGVACTVSKGGDSYGRCSSPTLRTGTIDSRYDRSVDTRTSNIPNDPLIVLVNPNDDTSVEALEAWIAELEASDDWIDLPTTAAELIAEDRSGFHA